jgi:hypothetical protein
MSEHRFRNMGTGSAAPVKDVDEIVQQTAETAVDQYECINCHNVGAWTTYRGKYLCPECMEQKKVEQQKARENIKKSEQVEHENAKERENTLNSWQQDFEQRFTELTELVQGQGNYLEQQLQQQQTNPDERLQVVHEFIEEARIRAKKGGISIAKALRAMGV